MFKVFRDAAVGDSHEAGFVCTMVDGQNISADNVLADARSSAGWVGGNRVSYIKVNLERFILLFKDSELEGNQCVAVDRLRKALAWMYAKDRGIEALCDTITKVSGEIQLLGALLPDSNTRMRMDQFVNQCASEVNL